MKKRFTTTRNIDGKKIHVFIDEDGKIFINVSENVFSEKALIIDTCNGEIIDTTKASYLQKIAEF